MLPAIRVGLKKYASDFLVDIIHTPRDDGASMVFPVTNPHRTQLGQITHDLVVQVTYGEGDSARHIMQPMPTQTTRQDTALIMPYYSTGVAKPTSDPIQTVTTIDRHALIVPPFLLGYYTRVSGVQAAISGIDEAMPTQSTQPRHYLVEPHGAPPNAEDCGFRMLQPHEIHNAMAFPSDYQVLGNKREQVRQLGNAVTPPVMKMLVERVVRAL